MDIGRLNRRIDILKYEVTRDEYGGEQREWVKVKSLWASIQPVSGTEYFKAQQVEAQNITTIIIRYRTDISVLNRVRYLDKTYEIIGISDNFTNHKMLTLNCKEIVSYGV